MEDIALIKLKNGFTLNHKINPACLPMKPQFKNIIGQKIQVAGWGRCNASLGVSPDILQHVKLQVMSHEKCIRKYIKDIYWQPGNWKDIKKKGFCAESIIETDAGIGTGQGDSGGAAIWMNKKNQNNRNRAFVIGLISNGDVTCGPGMKPDIFAAISKKVVKWIKKKAKKDLCILGG